MTKTAAKRTTRANDGNRVSEPSASISLGLPKKKIRAQTTASRAALVLLTPFHRQEEPLIEAQ